jgi:hypothetical protein
MPMDKIKSRWYERRGNPKSLFSVLTDDGFIKVRKD